MNAIRGIGILCKGTPTQVTRMARVLAQLLTTGFVIFRTAPTDSFSEKAELVAVKQTLGSLFALDSKGL